MKGFALGIVLEARKFGSYGAVLTADYPFNGIDDKGHKFRVLGASFSRFRCFVLWSSFSKLPLISSMLTGY